VTIATIVPISAVSTIGTIADILSIYNLSGVQDIVGIVVDADIDTGAASFTDNTWGFFGDCQNRICAVDSIAPLVSIHAIT